MVEQGLDRLVNYWEGQEPADLEEGLARVESGYWELDQTQDEALLHVEDDDEEDEEDE